MSTSTTGINRTLVRLADSLVANVLPHVDNHFAQLQVRAMREMLLNLSARVEPLHADADGGENLIRDALRSLGGIDGESRISAAAKPEDAAKDLRQLREELGQVISVLYDMHDSNQRKQALDVVWRVIRSDYDAEARRIKTGMYS